MVDGPRIKTPRLDLEGLEQTQLNLNPTSQAGMDKPFYHPNKRLSGRRVNPEPGRARTQELARLTGPHPTGSARQQEDEEEEEEDEEEKLVHA
eukprot:2801430-Amphidinium_carterae.1